MATRFRTTNLYLNNQLLTATGNNLFINGVNNIETTGTNLQSQINQKPQFHITFSTDPATWLSMPAALNFFNASTSYITYVDLTNYTGVNLIINKGATAAASTGALFLRYLDNPSFTASNYKDLDSTSVKISVNVQNTIINSGFKPINTAARSGVYIALCGSSGNNSLSPVFGNITAIFK